MDDVRMNSDQGSTKSEISAILSNYDLGYLVDFERNYRGYLNISYSIQTIKHGQKFDYFLRRYRIGTKPEDILFEHTLVNHLIEKEFNIVAKVHPTKQGSTYCAQVPEGDGDQQFYYAIFEFLLGEDKYTWVDPHCSPREIKNAATTLASFHQAVADIIPKGRRTEPRIIDLLPKISDNFDRFQPKEIPNQFDECLISNLAKVLDNCRKTLHALKMVNEGDWPYIVIHCDYHPGNLKFEGEEIVGLFDFDWSKIDLRCFDVALASWYYFTNWYGEQDGTFRMDEFKDFVNHYQESFLDKAILKPMNNVELGQLHWLISAANLYVLNWTVVDYSSKEVDPNEYLMYLEHSINFIDWFNLEGMIVISSLTDSIRRKWGFKNW
jgi:homoserine kinase type II